MTPEDENTAEERHCYQMLVEIRKRHEAAAKPYVDRLAAIKSAQPSPALVLTLDQAREFINISILSTREV
jgi:hypothetical protein